MSGLSMGAAITIAQRIPWGTYRTFVDIGTAQGNVPVQVVSAHPHLAGGGFDLPALGPIFEEYVAWAGLTECVHFYPGDFFVDRLPSADVLIIGHILNDWDLERKRTLLAKAYTARRTLSLSSDPTQWSLGSSSWTRGVRARAVKPTYPPRMARG